MSKTNRNAPIRTKGFRNASVEYALLGCKGGPMRNRRDRRSKDAKRSWQKDLEVNG